VNKWKGGEGAPRQWRKNGQMCGPVALALAFYTACFAAGLLVAWLCNGAL